ncbi:hypothetical protein SDRG_08286 [Saprolegnia diclina VS20]|uniref:Uncharacterized protein n=1 Tax=Saprolegnia diclina (strain VS20) TaxID=1156394 RepID=T0RNW2_SAPDV|nr:hypothetical protein SDRG_08286 [Saprolegnia diclina VS20]EQC34073.1 hypothetical protein SDRG_08286 [Saprolegnia diclina VS20]|eukprot:XP_008612385.1 hypothetical protein SDRG_08286 [Saprolegnia diclina VS20]
MYRPCRAGSHGRTRHGAQLMQRLFKSASIFGTREVRRRRILIMKRSDASLPDASTSCARMDRRALAQRLADLQGDVSKLASRLAAPATGRTRPLVAAVRDVAPAATAPPGPSAARRNQGSSTIPGGRMGNLIRLQRDLHDLQNENDHLRFEMDQMKRSMAAAHAKLRGYDALHGAYVDLQAQCATLQESLELSESIRARQKMMLQKSHHDTSVHQQDASVLRVPAPSRTAPQSTVETKTTRTFDPIESRHPSFTIALDATTLSTKSKRKLPTAKTKRSTTKKSLLATAQSSPEPPPLRKLKAKPFTSVAPPAKAAVIATRRKPAFESSFLAPTRASQARTQDTLRRTKSTTYHPIHR